MEGALTKQQITHIERVQKRALKIILGSNYTTYDDVLANCNLQSLNDRRKSLCVVFYKRTTERTNQFKQFIPPKNNTRVLRNKLKIPEIRCKTKRMQDSAIPYLIKLHNME